VQEVLGHRGPLAAWSLLEALPPCDPASTDEGRARLLAVRAQVAATFRDFDTAHALAVEAARLQPGTPWPSCVRAMVLERDDRYEDALALARETYAAHPDSRAAAQQAAQCLVLLDRREEALDLLRGAADRLESAHLVMQLAALERSLKHLDEALAALGRFEALSPLMEPALADGRNAFASAIAYDRGDVEGAIALARRSRSPVLQRLAGRMVAAGPAAARKELDVPFVRQHQLTCVPATLSAVSRYWRMPADHLAVVDAICYDGTPAHSERAWAEDNGWVAGEFTVDWDAVRALVDRGVPFVVTTMSAVEGHAQAVVGYDERRTSFKVRDPTHPDVAEADLEAFLRVFRSWGPRGMWLVPAAEAQRLQGLALPDAALWDRLYAVQRTLSRHDRDAARAEVEALRASAPEHRIAIAAQRALAAYDVDFV
jgi:tetratricopeptide (TPR) repeat protein